MLNKPVFILLSHRYERIVAFSSIRLDKYLVVDLVVVCSLVSRGYCVNDCPSLFRGSYPMSVISKQTFLSASPELCLGVVETYIHLQINCKVSFRIHNVLLLSFRCHLDTFVSVGLLVTRKQWCPLGGTISS